MTIKNLESNKFGNVRALCGHSEEVIAELKDKYDAIAFSRIMNNSHNVCTNLAHLAVLFFS